MKDRGYDPRALDVAALSRQAQHLEGEFALATMPRLVSGLAAAPDNAVAWSVQGRCLPVAGGEAEIWLDLRAGTLVVLQCQRCLQAMSERVVVDRPLRFVRSEQEAARLDEASEDDVLVLSARLDLHALVEDELILALPLVPRHDECPQPLPLAPDDLADEPQVNPFAALAALRGRGH